MAAIPITRGLEIYGDQDSPLPRPTPQPWPLLKHPGGSFASPVNRRGNCGLSGLHTCLQDMAGCGGERHKGSGTLSGPSWWEVSQGPLPLIRALPPDLPSHEQTGKLRPGGKEGLLREQHGVEGRAENRSTFADAPCLPGQVLVRRQKLTQGSGGGARDTCLEAHTRLAVTTHRSQGSPPHPLGTIQEAWGWTVFPGPQ